MSETGCDWYGFRKMGRFRSLGWHKYAWKMVNKEVDIKYIFCTSLIWSTQKDYGNIIFFSMSLWNLFCNICFSLYNRSSHTHVFHLCLPWLVPPASSPTSCLSSIPFRPLKASLSWHSEPIQGLLVQTSEKRRGSMHAFSISFSISLPPNPSFLTVYHQIQHVQKIL